MCDVSNNSGRGLHPYQSRTVCVSRYARVAPNVDAALIRMPSIWAPDHVPDRMDVCVSSVNCSPATGVRMRPAARVVDLVLVDEVCGAGISLAYPQSGTPMDTRGC